MVGAKAELVAASAGEITWCIKINISTNGDVESSSRKSKVKFAVMSPRLSGLTAHIRTVTHIDVVSRFATLVANLRQPSCATNSSSFLIPCLQTRHASILADLRDNDGAYNRRKRKGRGPSSGMGKTSGRGHKGQKQHGKVPARFQGGQTPDDVVHHQRGHENRYVLETKIPRPRNRF